MSGSGRRNAARLNGGKAEQPAASLPAFDETLSQLEATVAALEGGQLPLDEALALFERGMRLAQTCQRVLDAAELRIQQLVAEEDGEGAIVTGTLDFDLE
jgi:exodeoxyribonuclease VII small subunit